MLYLLKVINQCVRVYVCVHMYGAQQWTDIPSRVYFHLTPNWIHHSPDQIKTVTEDEWLDENSIK